MRSTLLFGSVCVVLAHAAAASAAPAWCKGGENKPTYDLKSVFSETRPDWALQGLVAASCYPEDDLAALTKQVAAARAAWSKKLGLADADWTEVSEWAHLPNYLRGDPKIAVKDRHAAWSAYSPLDQFGALVAASIGSVDAAYLADAFGANLGQLGRLGYVAQCLEGGDDPAVRWAMCAPDAAALDLAKIYAEIGADTTHGAGDRMTVRLIAYDLVSAKLPKYLADTNALRAKDPAYATMFSLADAAHAQWSKTDPRWIALASDLDVARVTGSRKASQGCIERTWDAWKTVVAAIPAKRLAAIHPVWGNEFAPQLIALVVSEPNGYLAALALNQCAKLEEKEDFLGRWIGNALVRWPGFRGPRTATQTAILTAGLKLDDRSASIDFPKLARGWISGDGNVGTAARGAIQSVKLEGDRATVTFAKQKVLETRCTKGHDTNRISQIMSDGTVHYYYQCDTEVTEMVEVAPSPPVRVAARYATGLKAGMTVQVSDDVAVVAYGKSGAPVLVTGVEVK